jgi:putative DNA primase/helicase
MQSTPGDTWSEKPAGTMTNAIAALPGVRLVTTIETEKGHRLAEGLVKQVTGGDKISTRKLFHEFFEFTPQLKLWIATNNKPKVSGSDGAIWDRMRLLPFNVKFVPQEELIEGQKIRDNDLMDKLLAELPGILAWMVRGCAEWQRVGLKPAVAMTEAAGAYRQGQDNVQGFIDECCDLSRGLTCAVKRLYGTYEMWCAEVDEEALSRRAFGKNLEERGFPAGKSGNIRLRKRIDLKGEWRERADQLEEC